MAKEPCSGGAGKAGIAKCSRIKVRLNRQELATGLKYSVAPLFLNILMIIIGTWWRSLSLMPLLRRKKTVSLRLSLDEAAAVRAG